MNNYERTNRAWQLIDQGKLADAHEHAVAVLARDANYAPALHACGYIELQAGRAKEAVALLTRVVQLEPKRAEAHLHLAEALHAIERSEAAIATLRRAVAIDPRLLKAVATLGIFLEQKGSVAEAATVIARAADAHPDNAELRTQLAHLLCLLDDIGGAEAAARRAIALDARVAAAHMHLGYALLQQNRLAEAEDSLRRAMSLGAHSAEDQLQLAMVLLARGDLLGGLAAFESRFAARAPTARFEHLHTPRWDGGDLRGRTLLVQAEQGFGDLIQMSRFIPVAIRSANGRVVLRCRKPLIELMRTLDGGPEVCDEDNAPPAHDVHVPVMSLPRALGTTLQTIPATVPYLHADAAKMSRWAKVLPPRPQGGLRVGIAWAGNPQHMADRQRSIHARHLSPLHDVQRPMTWVSLQKEGGGARPDLALFDPTPQFDDFADAGAVVAQLDLIISADTAVAHLAGALARPVWVLLPFAAEWRWLIEREDSPWYPTMRLFRQPRPGDWPSVVARVAKELPGLMPSCWGG